MESKSQQSKVKSGLTAGITAIAVLFAMSLIIGGVGEFFGIVMDLGLLFLAISVLSFIFGIFFSNCKLIWSFLVGAATGLICGLLIVFYIVSGI